MLATQPNTCSSSQRQAERSTTEPQHLTAPAVVVLGQRQLLQVPPCKPASRTTLVALLWASATKRVKAHAVITE